MNNKNLKDLLNILTNDRLEYEDINYSNWFNNIRNADFFKKNIFVKFTSIKSQLINQIGIEHKIFNLIGISFFTDFDYNIDLNDDNSRNKLRSLFKGKLLIVKVDCTEIENSGLNINKSNYINKENLLNKIIFDDHSKFGILYINILELLAKSDDIENIPNLINLIHNGYKNDIEIIFCFEKTIWFKLIFILAQNYIYVSGGNSTKRHLLSKNHLILSLFLACFDKNYLLNITQNLNSDINLISKKIYTDSILIKSLKFKNIEPVVLELIINYMFNYEMYLYFHSLIYDYIKEHPKFIDSIIGKNNFLNKYHFNDRKGVIDLDIESEDESKHRYLLLKHPESFKYGIDPNQNLNLEIPNYEYLKSLIYLYKDCQTKKKNLDKFISSIFIKKNNEELDFILKKDIKTMKIKTEIIKNRLNSNLLSYNSQNILNANKNIRKYSSYNISVNLNENVELKDKKYIEIEGIKEETELDIFIKEFNTNPLFNNIMMILTDESIKNNELKQEKIEKNLSFFWKLEIEKIFQGKKSLFSSGYGIGLINNAIIGLKRDILDFKNSKIYLKGKPYKEYILLLEGDLIISIVLSNVIPNCINNVNLNLVGLYEKVGTELIDSFFNQEWLKYNENFDFSIKEEIDIRENYYMLTNNLFNSLEDENTIINHKTTIKLDKKLNKEEFIIKLQSQEILQELSSDDYFKLGSDMIEFIANKCDLFKLINKKNEDNTVNRVLISDKGLEDIIIRITTLDCDKFPMICKPKPWEIQIKNENYNEKDDLKQINLEKIEDLNIKNYGGYLLNENKKISFIRKNFSNLGEIKFKNQDIPNTLNKLSSVKFTINYKVLNYIFELLNKNYKEILEFIKLSPHTKTKELYRLSLSNKWAEINEIQKHNNKYYNDKAIIQRALLFKDWLNSKENSLYFSYFIDWRGRFYTDTSFFSFQAGELSRSLIIFKEGKPLTEEGLEALKIYTANCYGLNKLSHNDRIQWINSNLNFIKEMDPNFIFSASEPLLFLSCCFELNDYFKDKKNFISRLPIYLDATCNGLQHLSSMINEASLAKLVNIVKSNKNDMPNDVYNKMVYHINLNIKEFVNANPNYSNLLLLNITRAFIKRGIMTITYGVTIRGIAQQLQNDFFILLDPEKGKKRTFLLKNKEFGKKDMIIQLTYKEVYKLAEIIHDILYKTFPNLTYVVEYFKDINRLLKKLSLSTVWLTPSGMLIEQKYVQTKKVELVSSILGKRKSFTIRKPDKDKIDLKKQNSGIVPNIVHSMDASNVALLIKGLLNIGQDIDIVTIHDCFGCQANNVELMKIQVKIAFLFIYGKENFIVSYHKFILEYISKSGYIVDLKNNKIIDLKNNKYKLPIIPKFENFPEIKENILGSQYFIN